MLLASAATGRSTNKCASLDMTIPVIDSSRSVCRNPSEVMMMKPPMELQEQLQTCPRFAVPAYYWIRQYNLSYYDSVLHTL